MSAAYGIFQYAILHYDSLGQRPQGTLGHYMTYSGLLMLVIGAALARILFGRSERTWAALVMPALVVAVSLTFSRNAWVGACAAAALLFSLKDFRLLAVLPVVAAIFFGIAPSTGERAVQFDFRPERPVQPRSAGDDARRRAHDWRPSGRSASVPNMVERVYVQYRVPEAEDKINPHLHNVPLQIAAERGLPALAAWLAFIVILCRRSGPSAFMPASSGFSPRSRSRRWLSMLGGRHVRVQLRRFRIPDAVPDAGDAAVRRGAPTNRG